MYAIAAIDLFVAALFVSLLGLAVISDIEALRIPNQICALIAALYPIHVLSAGGDIDWIGALAVSFAVFAVGLLPFSLGLMGGGDVKLMAAVALWAGPNQVIEFLIVTALFGAVVALVMMAPARFALAQVLDTLGFDDIRQMVLGRAIPYAIAIAAGALLTVWPALSYG